MRAILNAIGWALIVTSVTIGLAACATTSGTIRCEYTAADGWTCAGGAQGEPQIPPVATPGL